MKNVITLAIALAILVVFPGVNWAQEEEEEPIQAFPRVERTVQDQINQVKDDGEHGTVKDDGEHNLNAQINRAQELQKIESNAAAASQTDGCRVQNISIGDKDKVEVGYGCFSGVTLISSNILVDRDNNGFVDTFKDSSAATQTEFRSLTVERKAAAEAQYDSAMFSLDKTMQAVAIAQGTNMFKQGEKCNQFTTENGDKYEVFAVFGRSEKNQPVLLGYKVKQTVNGNTVTLDISAGSLYKTVFSGIIPSIHSGGCQLSEWVIISDKINIQ